MGYSVGSRVILSDGRIRTPTFSYLRGIERNNEGLVEQMGIEPTTP